MLFSKYHYIMLLSKISKTYGTFYTLLTFLTYHKEVKKNVKYFNNELALSK